jgi:hypothetical protein
MISLQSGYTSIGSRVVIDRGDTYRVRNPWVLFRLMVLGCKSFSGGAQGVRWQQDPFLQKKTRDKAGLLARKNISLTNIII